MMRYLLILILLAPLVAGMPGHMGEMGEMEEHMDGHDIMLVHAGEATFGVKMDETPAIFALCPVYAGEAHVVGPSGEDLGTRPIKVLRFFVHRFLYIVEFNDANGNGLWDASTGAIGDRAERIVAYARMNGTWDVRNESGAIILTGHLIARSPAATVSRGTEVNVTIEVEFRQDMYNGTTQIPVYRVSVDPARKAVRRVALRGYRSVEGWGYRGTFKYSIAIEGWPARKGDSLTVVTGTFFGVAMDRVTSRWVHRNVVGTLTPSPSVMVNNGSALSTDVRADKDGDGIPDSMAARKMAFDRRIPSMLRWVSNATVDNRTVHVRFGVIRVERAVFYRGGMAFHGIRVVGGYVYPAGKVIVHDPEVIAASLSVNIQEEYRALFPGSAMALQISIGLLVAAVAFFRRSVK